MPSRRLPLLLAAALVGGTTLAATGASAITNRYTLRQAPGFTGLLFGEGFYGEAPYGYERPIRRAYRPYGPGAYGYDGPPPPPPFYDGY